MAKKPNKKSPKGKLNHPEAKGLFLLAISAALLVSLISFVQNRPSDNFLGIIGYLTAFTMQYLFGLGSYLIIAFLAWTAGKLFSKSEKPSFRWQTLYFALLLISGCLLLSVLSEKFPKKAEIMSGRVYTETLTLKIPKTEIVRRYNLGGVPFYFLYKDLPYFNLQKMLSNFGITLIFSLTSFLSFLLLTGIQIRPNLRRMGRISQVLLRFSWDLFKNMGKKIHKTSQDFTLEDFLTRFAKKKQEAAQKQPRIKAPTLLKEPAAEIEQPKIPAPAYTPLVAENTAPVKINTLKQKKVEPDEKPSLLASLSEAITKADSNFRIPPPDLLTSAKQIDHPTLKKDLAKQAKVLEETLKSFGIEGKVVEINCGPTITSFEVQPPIGVKVQKIKALENDIALNMEAKSIRILAPIPGKAVIGVEIPALHPQEVSFKEMLLYYQQKGRKLQIPILLGKTVGGDHVIADLAKMPHCLIAGATGSGKSVCINTIVMSILMNAGPDEVKLLMIDPKKVELTQYSNLPHMIAPVISEAHGAYAAMQWLVREMQLRYEILKVLGLRNITAFNSRKIRKEVEAEFKMTIPERMPLIVGIIDEFADLMMVSSSDLETPIARIAQMARAVGIHLILATQRPSREVITGIIKANFPTRIAFKVSSRINSQIILDEVGAESLLGNGDMLFLPPGSSNLVRAQGAYISDEDINKVVGAICEQLPPHYLISSFDAMKRQENEEEGDDPKHSDNLYDQALEIVLASKNASTTYLQRKLKIGYARAASIIDELEKNGVIGPQEGSKPRRILMSLNNTFEEEPS